MFSITKFKGLRPKVSPLLLQIGEATEAVDVLFRDGKATPIQRPTRLSDIPADKQGLALLDKDTPVYFDYPVQQVRTRDRTVVVDKAGEHPPVYWRGRDTGALYQLGMPRPTAAPTAARVNLGGDDMPITASNIGFAYSFRNRDGDLGDLSDQVVYAAQPLEVVRLSGLEGIPATDPAWDTTGAKIIVYRTVPNSSELFWVKELDVGATEVVIDLDTDVDPIGLPRRQYSGLTSPPSTIRSMHAHPAGFWVALAEVGDPAQDVVRFSETGDISRWPPEYAYTVPRGEITGIAVNVDQVCVFPTDESPVILSMVVPFESQATQTTIPWPCVSGASIVNTGVGVLYCADAGVVVLTGYQGKLTTLQHFDRRTFAAYKPRQCRAYHVDGVYHVYGNGKPFCIDVLSLDGYEICGISSEPDDVKVVDGTAFGVRGRTLFSYETSALSRTMAWTSGLIRLPEPMTVGAFRVRADFTRRTVTDVSGGGPGLLTPGAWTPGRPEVRVTEREGLPTVLFELIDEDGSLLFSADVQDSNSQALPVRHKLDTFRVRLVSDITVESFGMAATQSMLAGMGS